MNRLLTPLVIVLLVASCTPPNPRATPTQVPLATVSVARVEALINPSGPPQLASASIVAETHAVAEPFIQALLRRNFEAAREYYAPAIRPESWEEIIPIEVAAGIPADFSECIGAQPIVGDVPDSATQHSVTFRFSSDCVAMPVPSQADQNVLTVQRFNSLGVRLQKLGDRWWVTGIGTFRGF